MSIIEPPHQSVFSMLLRKASVQLSGAAGFVTHREVGGLVSHRAKPICDGIQEA